MQNTAILLKNTKSLQACSIYACTSLELSLMTPQTPSFHFWTTSFQQLYQIRPQLKHLRRFSTTLSLKPHSPSIIARSCNLLSEISCSQSRIRDSVETGNNSSIKQSMRIPSACGSKSFGYLHPCGNYRALSGATLPGHYRIQDIRDFSNSLWGKMVFSKLDLTRA